MRGFFFLFLCRILFCPIDVLYGGLEKRVLSEIVINVATNYTIPRRSMKIEGIFDSVRSYRCGNA